MADFTALKTAIQTYIKQNGNEEITGEKLQEILLSMVTTLGDSAINDLITALNDEVAARQNADGTLQQNITNEATARGNADTALGGRIDDEATARANGDTALSNRLGSTITAENTAADQIGAEAEARAAADTALQNLIDGITNNIENGYVYAGIATPSSTPATGKVFYLALTAGTYTNFGNTEVSQGINILKYNGSAWSLDAFIGIDDTPTPNSPKLVKSGGVAEELALGAVYDVSAKNPTAGPNNDGKWESLSALLSDANLNTLIPTAVRKGGMSIKFVCTSDNKYVQFRFLRSDPFTATQFTNPANWLGVNKDDLDKIKKSREAFVSGLDSNTYSYEADSSGIYLTKFLLYVRGGIELSINNLEGLKTAIGQADYDIAPSGANSIKISNRRKLVIRNFNLVILDYADWDLTDRVLLAVNDGAIKGGELTCASLADKAIPSRKIADEAITTAKIADEAITTAKIASSAITTAKIADNAVKSSKIASNAVTSDKILNEAINKEKLKQDVVDTIAASQMQLNATTKVISLSGETNYGGWININSQSGWEDRSQNGHYMLHIAPNTEYIITLPSTANKNTYYAFLSERPTYEGTRPLTYPAFVEGVSDKTVINIGQTLILKSPIDAAYLYIQKQDSLNIAPTIIQGNGVIANINEIWDFITRTEVTHICHRGNSAVDCPENSIHSITNAYFQGQKFVECDVRETSDHVYVIMHDTSINRTMNTAEDIDISQDPEILVSSLTWQQLHDGYIYKTNIQKYKTPVTSFSEWLDRVVELNLIPMFHNLPTVLLSVVKERIGERFIYMGRLDGCLAVREAAPKCYIMYQYSQYESNESITNINGLIGEMKRIGGKVGYSSMTLNIFTNDVVKALIENGFDFQYSTEESYHLAEAINKGAKFILANNLCNNALTYHNIYRMKDDLSNITHNQTENGMPKYNTNETLELTVEPSGQNVRAIITLNGEIRVSVGGTQHVINNYGAFRTFCIGLNCLSSELTFNISFASTTLIKDIVIQSN